MNTSRILCLCVLLPAVAAWAKSADPPKSEAPIVWRAKVTPGPAVTLALKRNVGKVLVYEGTLTRSQKSLNSYDQRDTFYLNVFCADRKDELDRVAIQRTYTNRQRTETLENKKQIDRILPNTTDLINLGPNFDIVGNLRCYAYDAQNRVAYRTEQLAVMKDGRLFLGKVLTENDDKIVFLTKEDKVDLPRADLSSLEPAPVPHVLENETPHFFFPIFSRKKVAPGDTWRFKVPVIFPIEHGTPPRLFPTQFYATLVGRLREVREAAGKQTAVVDYQVAGKFDSSEAEFSPRFGEEFVNSNRIAHRIAGEGEVTVDVEKGRILHKAEAFNITLYASSIVPQGLDKDPKKEESQAEINASFEIRLLPPGTRLKSDAVIPDYD
jgi:hypothetical protein